MVIDSKSFNPAVSSFSLATATALIGCCSLLAVCCPAFAEQPVVGSNLIYTVKKGDTLESIRTEFSDKSIDWKVFAKLNGIKQTKRLAVGKELKLPIQWLSAQPAFGTVTLVSGKATVDNQLAAVGSQVKELARVTTDPDSNIEILLSDGTTMRVGSASSIVIDRLKQYHSPAVVEARVRLEKGRLETSVAPQRQKPIDVVAPGATAAVRGTQFGVSTDSIASSVDVPKGNVAWSGNSNSTPGKAESVPAGFGAAVDKTGSVSGAQALSPAVDVSNWPKDVTKIVSEFPITPVAGAASYRLQVALDENFKTLLNETVRDKPVVTLISKEDGPHYIRVKAISANLIEGFSATGTVNVAARPVAPNGVVPKNGATTFEKNILLSWLDTPGFSYRIQTDKTGDFKTPLTDEVLSKSQTTTSLTEGSTFWRVASIEPSRKQGPFSDASKIELVASPALPKPTTKDDVMEFSSSIPLSDKTNQLEVQFAADEAFSKNVLTKRFSQTPAQVQLSAGNYFVKLRYILEGYAPDAVPFGATQTFRMVEPLRSTFGGAITSGDGSSVILGR
jgi:hypothetical protein